MVEVSKDVAKIFVPLVIGIVVQLSNIERGRDGGPEKLAGTNPFFFTRGPVPQLGRLNFVHGTNLILLLGCYLLATALDPGLFKTLLVVFVLVVWLQLPILAVKEYGSLLADANFPRSFDLHLVTTLAIAAYVWQFGSLTQFVGSVNATVLEETDFLRNGVVALLALSWYSFLHFLQIEINDEEDDDADGGFTAKIPVLPLTDYNNAEREAEIPSEKSD